MPPDAATATWQLAVPIPTGYFLALLLLELIVLLELKNQHANHADVLVARVRDEGGEYAGDILLLAQARERVMLEAALACQAG